MSNNSYVTSASVAVLTLVAAFLFQTTDPVMAAGKELPPECVAKIEAIGIPHRTQKMAEFNAQKSWLTKAHSKSPALAMWHNARDKSFSCSKLGRSTFYKCSVVALACARKSVVN